MKQRSVKKIVLFVLLATVTFGGVYAFWDVLTTSQNETVQIGKPIELRLESTKTKGVLVPSQSYFAGQEGYTTEYVFTYNLEVDNEDLEEFDFNIELLELTIGDFGYGDIDLHDTLDIEIHVLDNVYRVDSKDTTVLLENVSQTEFGVVITISFNDTIGGAKGIGRIAGKELTYNIRFEIVIPISNP